MYTCQAFTVSTTAKSRSFRKRNQARSLLSAAPGPSSSQRNSPATSKRKRPKRRNHGTSVRASASGTVVSASSSYANATTTAPTTISSVALQNDELLVQDLQRQYQELQHEYYQPLEETFQLSPRGLEKIVVESSSSSSSLETTTDKDKSVGDAAINKARLLLLVAAALYGTNFSCVKLLGEAHIPVGASSTLRFGMAAIATLPWLLPPKEDWDKVLNSSKQNIQTLYKTVSTTPSFAAAAAGLEVGLWNSIGYVAQAVGLETTAASKSAFLCSLAVVVVPLLDFVSGKLLLPRQLVGTLLALGGVGILELGGQVHDLTLSSGDIASLIQPLAFGMGFWRMEQAMHKYPCQAMRSTAGQLMAVFMASALFATITEPGSLGWEHVHSWITDPMILAGLFWTGVVTTALTVYMETVALETLSAAETTLIFSTEPLWGTLTAATVMGEQLGMDSAIGALLIVTGCVFSNLGFEGIASFFSPGGAVTPTAVVPVPSGESSVRNNLALFRAGIAATLDSSTSKVWNAISVGTKVMAIEAQNFIEEVAPWLTTSAPEASSTVDEVTRFLE